MTHGLGFLPQVDYIYVMKNGSVSQSGTYEELREEVGDFAEFLSNINTTSLNSPDSDGKCSHCSFPHVKHIVQTIDVISHYR